VFVKWQRKPRTEAGDVVGYRGEFWTIPIRERVVHDHLLTATLVESERIDGKPRQRTIGYLGSIREKELTSALARDRTLAEIEQRLDDLGDAVPPAEREHIQAKIHDRVPPPSDAEMKAERIERDTKNATVRIDLGLLTPAEAKRRFPLAEIST